jgi:hypothetical protein
MPANKSLTSNTAQTTATEGLKFKPSVEKSLLKTCYASAFIALSN